MKDLFSEHFFYIIESIGIISFALSGVILAKKKDFDIVGVYIIAWVTAFGGGTIRDVILDIQPVYWINHSEYPLIIFVIVVLLSLVKKIKVKSSWLIIPDTLGLSVFAITTAQMAQKSGYPTIIVAILATIVATFGGVLRDTLCKEIPMIFTKNQTLYASLAFLGACFYVGLTNLNYFTSSTVVISSVSAIFISRLIAYKFNWRVKI